MADGSGAFSGTTFTTTALNNNNEVVFGVGLTAGGTGIYDGPDAVANKIIATGDALDGSTVTNVSFGRLGLNDLGEIAFEADLADGRSGIYIASPNPEPGTLFLTAVTAAPGLGYAWRQRRRNSSAPAGAPTA